MRKYIKNYYIGYDILLVNKVIRNTYILLSFILLFSSFMAWVSVVTHAKSMGITTFFLFIFLFYLINLFKNSNFSIFFLFLFTGYMGYSLGPLLNVILYNFVNGQEIVILSFCLSSFMFILLSLYALFTKNNFNYLGGFLFVLFSLIISLSIIGLLFSVFWVHLLVSFFIIIISCLYILYDTSQLILGGERNYVIATINLYLNFFNLFVSILRILTFFTGRKD